ncbi:MAG: sigma-70 family RNA polymerase sigma factor [Ruminococcaceae bacterium]|nr:sigma-70 family RNA polymerase sigma factor [Oscillospiraceae bacterium]
MDDRQIIDLYNQRNESAISETSEKYGKYCFNIANNILLNVESSEECVNDTWLRTWNSIPPQKPHSLRLFLAKITRNLAFDRYKNDTRKKRGGGEIVVALDEISEIVSNSDRVDTEAEERELMAAFNRFLRAIPKRDCNIFIERYFYVESTGVIAKKYGLSVSNVQKILFRTRGKLKDYLETEGYTV